MDQFDAEGTFSEWYAAEFDRVRTALSLVVGDSSLAEEATAEAFAKALLRWKSLSHGPNPTAWVYKVALNEVRTKVRRSLTERRCLARMRTNHSPPPPDPDPFLWATVAKLAPRARTAVVLRYVMDLTEADVARIMDISPGTAAATLHQARKRLSTLLNDSNDEGDDTGQGTRTKNGKARGPVRTRRKIGRRGTRARDRSETDPNEQRPRPRLEVLLNGNTP